MSRRCEMELCPHWSGDGDVCPCAVLELSRPSVVPAGPYAQGGRSPIVWVLLCPVCAGYVPQTAEDYQGFLSGQCGGCGAHVRELHRFRAWIDSAARCNCTGSHPRVVGEVAP